jgi:hypothetical protein
MEACDRGSCPGNGSPVGATPTPLILNGLTWACAVPAAYASTAAKAAIADLRRRIRIMTIS